MHLISALVKRTHYRTIVSHLSFLRQTNLLSPIQVLFNVHFMLMKYSNELVHRFIFRFFMLGTFPSQPQQSMQSFSPFGTTSPINGAIGAQQNPFSSPASSLQTGNGADKQFNLFNSEPNLASGAFGQTTVSTQLM